MSEWLPVTERLPEHGGTVVCRTSGRELRFARVMRVTTYADGTPATEFRWMGYPDGQIEVTHWMELPEPPEVW